MIANQRRLFVLRAASAGLLMAACTKHPAELAKESSSDEEDVAPPEDLMREHGLLNRILLIYEECSKRFDNHQDMRRDAVAKGADIIHGFIEQYHEKLEEDYLFPRFEKAGKLIDLVITLRRQHLAGRALTDSIRRLATSKTPSNVSETQQLVAMMRSFVRMYRPHEAREDTILFPAFRNVVTSREFRELGEQFEDKEHALFGKEGFEGVVRQVEAIERDLEIYDLGQFTPT